MARSFLSTDWYRVGPLRPRLKPHVDIHRQSFRGGTWFIVQDSNTGKFHRLSPAGNLMVSLMDGRRSLNTLWEHACSRFPDDPPTQSETIRLLSQLHNADLITGDVPPDIAELARRHEKQERQTMLARIKNPLAMRLPLFDPDAFLDATVWLVRPLFTVWGFLLWLLLVGTGLTLAVLNWGLLTSDITDRVLTGENLFLLALAYPIVKTIHELGHAYATKVWGGEVHEVGTMFLVLIPVPYVDATAAAAFPEKHRRAIVGGAGIMVELALAAIAMLVWINAEPGLVRAFAFNVMLIGGVSTILFNGNPLLRFDGYFVLADLVEIPNLGQRANKYIFYLIQRYGFGLRDAENPVTARGERLWFVTYAVLAFFYRVFITFTIALFVAGQFFFIGILLAAWALANVFVFPLFKGAKFLLSAGSLRGRRGRAIGLSAGVLAALVAAVTLIPVPHRTMAEGIVLLSEDEILRAGTNGFVTQALPEQGPVGAGTTLLAMEDPILDFEARLAQTRLDEMRLRLATASATDAVQTRILREQVASLEGQVALFQTRRDALTLTADVAGHALIPDAVDLPGQHMRQGDIVGYLLTDETRRFRVAVPQTSAELVRSADRVDLRLSRATEMAYPARIVAQAPESQRILPVAGLGTEAGGPFALDPTDPQGQRTIESLFVFDVEVAALPDIQIGERALVRFDHGDAPLSVRILRGVRQLFLVRFNV